MTFHKGDIVAGKAKGTIYRLTGQVSYSEWGARVVTPGTDSTYVVGDKALLDANRVTLVRSFDVDGILDDDEDLS